MPADQATSATASAGRPAGSTLAVDVVVVGSFNVDHVWRCDALPKSGETLAGQYASGPGGKGFNQAVAAARSGAQTCFVCALGDDVGGQLARALATADAIDLRDERGTSPTGTAGIFVDTQGQNSIVIGPGANAELSTAFVTNQRDTLIAARLVLAQLESPSDAVAAALRVARDASRLTLLNPAPANVAVSSELLSLTDVLTPNETECAALFARHLGERIDPQALAGLESPRLHGLCRDLLPTGTVVITLGAVGCFVSHPDDARCGDESAWYRIAAETVDTVDTTGAGDAFNGALAASLACASNLPFAAHVRFANRYAALSTERRGAALSMPRRHDVQTRFG